MAGEIRLPDPHPSPPSRTGQPRVNHRASRPLCPRLGVSRLPRHTVTVDGAFGR